jgi:hypothetical protein
MSSLKKKLFKTKNSSRIDLESQLEDIKVNRKKATKQEKGACATLLGISTCGLSYLFCPCLLFIP